MNLSVLLWGIPQAMRAAARVYPEYAARLRERAAEAVAQARHVGREASNLAPVAPVVVESMPMPLSVQVTVAVVPMTVAVNVVGAAPAATVRPRCRAGRRCAATWRGRAATSATSG